MCERELINMGKLYTHGWYAKEMKKVDKSIVELLTGKEPTEIKLFKGIDLDSVEYNLKHSGSYMDHEVLKSGRVETTLFALNYAKIHSTVPPEIIDKIKGIGYEVYLNVGEEGKIITAFKSYRASWYDSDKIYSDNKFIWKGTVEDLLKEFENAGFTIKENLSREELDDYHDRYYEENWKENRLLRLPRN